VSEAQPLQPLAYATGETQENRLPALLVVWCLVAGLLAIGSTTTEILNGLERGRMSTTRFAELFAPPEPTTTVPYFLLSRSERLRFTTHCVGGFMLLATAGLMWMKRGQLARGPLLLFRLSASLILIGALAYSISMANYVVRQRLSLITETQVWLWAISSIARMLVPALLLMEMSHKRFYTDTARTKRLVAIAIVCWALPMALVVADQLIRWPGGVRPYMLGSDGESFVVFTAWWQLALVDIQRYLVPAMEVFAVIAAIGAVLLLRRSSPRARSWLRAFAAAWTIKALTPSVVNVIQIGASGGRWQYVLSIGLEHWLEVALAVAVLLVAFEPDRETTR
jgi:hypothetical protein